MLTTLAVSGYRSLRDVVIPLGRVTVVTGPNGSGKSNLYRSLRLLAGVARGDAIGTLAREGGLPSTLWAGPARIGRAVHEGRHPVQGTVRSGPVRLQLGFAATGFGYAADLGPPQAVGTTAFVLDPEVKAEHVWSGPVARPAAVLTERHGAHARSREGDGWRTLTSSLRPHESLLTEVADPAGAPELLELRERMRGWRFYDHLRTDARAPSRAVAVGTRTPVLASDGADLAAAVATIQEIGRGDRLAEAVASAFDGSEVVVDVVDGRFTLALRQPGMLRPLRAEELSDGTLRFLMLAAALLTPRPPELLVLNEPETSLHPDLLGPLGAMVRDAADQTQLVVVTHSSALRAALGTDADVTEVRLVKELGETGVEDQGALDRPAWTWPSR